MTAVSLVLSGLSINAVLLACIVSLWRFKKWGQAVLCSGDPHDIRSHSRKLAPAASLVRRRRYGTETGRWRGALATERRGAGNLASVSVTRYCCGNRD
ncbi:hypothetical protein [Mycobacterium lepromatosis]|uniref:hypothetical protein n=1 Tax=Mycobacterium lepromatosis TaxID=480418 RepID=UPI0012E0B59B|nr:hypothetical protein [Mycobacterium lepromatosis]